MVERPRVPDYDHLGVSLMAMGAQLSTPEMLTRWLGDGKPPIAVIVEPGTHVLQRWALPQSPVGILQYVSILAESMVGLVAMAKIQPAVFERHGIDGWFALKHAIRVLRDHGIAVVIDTKRSDHSPILNELVNTYLGDASVYGANGITLLPYLGVDEILAAAPTARNRGGLVMVIARTSNPGAALIQDAHAVSGSSVAAAVVQEIARHNAASDDRVALVIGGDHETAGDLIRGFNDIVVLPGWGRPGVDTAAVARTRAAAPDRTFVSMGSRFTSEGPHVPDLRSYLTRQADLLL